VEQHASISSDVIESGRRDSSHLGDLARAGALDAGREISGDRPLEELFQVILDLVVNSVGGSRGVIMIIEHGQLMPKAMRGTGFRISNAVRDRVMGDKESILILDASRHEVLSSSTTIQRQRVEPDGPYRCKRRTACSALSTWIHRRNALLPPRRSYASHADGEHGRHPD
jgi:hypothetical protein